MANTTTGGGCRVVDKKSPQTNNHRSASVPVHYEYVYHWSTVECVIMNEVIIIIKVILLNTYYGYPGTTHTHTTPTLINHRDTGGGDYTASFNV